jgi:hypothetical protein
MQSKLTAFVVIATSFLMAATLLAQTPPTQPALPKAQVSVVMPTQTSTVNVAAGNAAALTSALAAATCGKTIVLPAGSTYSGNFTIPNIGTCSGWVIVESSGVASLPKSARVSPASLANMATISTAKLAPAFSFAPGAHNFRFIGLQVDCGPCGATSATDLQTGLFEIDGTTTGVLPSTVASTPNEIIIDRCYIHGTPTQNIRSGIRANGTNIAIVDSYISEIHEAGAASAGDSQAIEDWNGAGPILIQDNYLEAASENVMFGGSKISVANLVPSDITITGNDFEKNPTWRQNAAPYNWVVKDSLEFKNAQRVLVEGNIFAYCWLAGQAGELVEFTPRATGGASWATAADITFTGNLLEHAAEGVILASSDNNDTPTSQPSQRILISNNVFRDLSSEWNLGGSVIGVLIEDISPTNTNSLAVWHDVTVDHNSISMSGTGSNCALYFTGSQSPTPVKGGPFQFTNNLASSGICGDGKGSMGNEVLAEYVNGATWSGNVLADVTLADYPTGTVAVYPYTGAWLPLL